MFAVQVIERSTGKPVYYKKVSVYFKGFTRGFTKDQYTGCDGDKISELRLKNGYTTIEWWEYCLLNRKRVI